MTQPNHLIPVIHFAEPRMVRGQGSYLFDTDGKRYLDLTSGQFCTVLGHSNAWVQDRVEESTRKLAHTSTAVLAETVVACSEELNRISGPMNAYSIILSTGAEVVEFCLRYAKNIQGKSGILCFDNGYHGLTLGAQSVTFGGRYAQPEVGNIYSVPVPPTNATGEQVAESLAGVEDALSRNPDIAAFLVEPIVSVGGMVFPPAVWFQKVRDLCDKYGVLFVLDECQTGFGRTGDWFAYETYGFVPDMVATAKGIGLGYPVAVALFRDSLVENKSYGMTHYSSHQNDAFGASIIMAGIEFIEKNDVLAQVREKSGRILKLLANLAESNPHVVDPRGCGMMFGADLFFDGVSDYRAIYADLNARMMEHGVLLQGTNGGRTLRFLPDYLIDVDAVGEAFDILGSVLNTEIAGV